MSALLALVLVWTVLIPVVVIAVSLLASRVSPPRRRPTAREATKVVVLDSYRRSATRTRRGTLLGQRSLRG